MADTENGSRGPDEQEFEFMAGARRNKLVGLWAAELLGLIGQATHDFMRDVGQRHGHGEDDMAEWLHGHLRGRATLAEIRDKMAHLLDEARRQLHIERKD